MNQAGNYTPLGQKLLNHDTQDTPDIQDKGKRIIIVLLRLFLSHLSGISSKSCFLSG